MSEHTPVAWPGQTDSSGSPGALADAGSAPAEPRAGARDAMRTSAPVLGSALVPAAGAAIASVCLSCIGIGGATAFGAALGTVVAWATPVGYLVGGLLTAAFVRRELRKRRASCPVSEFRRTRRVIVSVAVAVAAASYAVSAVFILPVVRVATSTGGGGSGVLP